MEESQALHGREEYRLYSYCFHRSYHRPIKLIVVRDDYTWWDLILADEAKGKISCLFGKEDHPGTLYFQ